MYTHIIHTPHVPAPLEESAHPQTCFIGIQSCPQGLLQSIFLGFFTLIDSVCGRERGNDTQQRANWVWIRYRAIWGTCSTNWANKRHSTKKVCFSTSHAKFAIGLNLQLHVSKKQSPTLAFMQILQSSCRSPVSRLHPLLRMEQLRDFIVNSVSFWGLLSGIPMRSALQ